MHTRLSPFALAASSTATSAALLEAEVAVAAAAAIAARSNGGEDRGEIEDISPEEQERRRPADCKKKSDEDRGQI